MTEFLFNQFYESLHRPQETWRDVPEYRGIIANARADLKVSERFVLDDEAMEHIMERSYDMERLMHRVQIASLPFDHLWIEYDNKSKTEYAKLKNRGPGFDENTPRRVGYLMRRLENRPTAWVAWEISNGTRDGSNMFAHGFHGFGYIFDSESERVIERLGRYKSFTYTTNDAVVESLTKQIGALKTLDIVKSKKLQNGLLWGVFPGGKYDVQDESSHKASATVAPLWRSLQNHSGPEGMDLVARVLAENAYESAGVMRFLTTALAFINHVPRVLRPVERQGEAKSFRAAGSIKPYLSGRVVSIDLTRTKAAKIKTIMRQAEVAARRRRHRVRGYFKFSPVQKNETWLPYRDEGGRLLYRRWIDRHERGDASLGWVNHDYEVTVR